MLPKRPFSDVCPLTVWLCVPVMDTASRGVSAMLLAANQRLDELRLLQAEAERPLVPASAELCVASQLEAVASLGQQVAALPDHLGWGSVAATQAVRAGLATSSHAGSAGVAGEGASETAVFPSRDAATAVNPLPGGSLCASSPTSNTVKHYPSLGVAALEKKETAALRVWLAEATANIGEGKRPFLDVVWGTAVAAWGGAGGRGAGGDVI